MRKSGSRPGLRRLPLLPRLLALLCVLLFDVASAQRENYTTAEALVRQGQLDRGMSLLSQILTKDPLNVQAHNLLGIALTGKSDLVAADKEYRKALQVQPNFVPALKNLAINELAQNQTELAVHHFGAALKLAPQDPVVHAYLGKIAYSRQEYRVAVNHLAKAGDLIHDPSIASPLADSELRLGQPEQAKQVLHQLEIGKMTPAWQFRLGLMLAQHEMFPEAIPFFQSASVKDPDSYDTAFDLAICYIETKQFPQAIATLNNLAGQGHKTAELYNLLSEAYEGNQQTQQAIDALRAAIELAPQDENSYVALTALCAKYKAYDLALEIIQTGLRDHPQSYRLIMQRGVIYAMQEKYDLAEQDFLLTSRLAPQQNLSDMALGVNYQAKGDLAKAIEMLRQRSKEKPNDAMFQYLLGADLIRSGAADHSPEFAEAREALEKSVKLDPKLVPARVELGMIYLREDRLDDAIQHLEVAHALDPKDKAACAQLAVAYRHQGKRDQALAILKTLKQLNEEERTVPRWERRLRIVTDETAPAKDQAQQ